MSSASGTRFPQVVRPGALSACVVSLGCAFPAGVSHLPFNWLVFLEKLYCRMVLSRTCFRLVYPLWILLFYEALIILKKFATLPAELLASQAPARCLGEEAWQTVGGKGADF
ncbi:hypothetical protein [Peribacillus simplex]|uniref:hypothetical protein n=1 Tax=Peribacillus simplex TaxID=1478 RepID=UPI003D2DBF32